MTCDGVRGCTGAFIANGKKVVGMQIKKTLQPDNNSSYVSYSEIVPIQ